VSRFGIARGLATTRALRYKGRESRSDSDFALPKQTAPAQRSLMVGLARTGFSIDPDLLKRFDRAISGKGYQNRSEAVRDLMRDYLVSEEADKNKVVAGTLTFVYDHHRPNLTEKLVEAQHQAGSQVLAATHVHLDHHNCLEVVMMKGRSGAIRDLSNRILSLQGVKHGQLVITSTGKDLK
jgi:CopG family transcriptional regulator, nickel-responsive regulator